MQMNQEAENRIAAKLAKTLAMLCARNTHLEAIHTGKSPITGIDRRQTNGFDQ